jgi:23S rRNA (guanosine2251-2'-O)-methyltransferase
MKKRGGSALVVFGRRAVLEALAEAELEVELAAAVRDLPAAFRKQLAAACRARGLQLELLPESEIHALSGEPRHDQGVALRLRLAHVLDVEVFVASRKGREARKPVRVLALDGVTNPQNVGMIVRSVVAAGLDGLLWPRIGSPWVSGLVVKSSASALYRCPILRCDSLAEGLTALKRGGFRIAGLAGDAQESLFDFAPPHRAVFVVGGETGGLSPESEALVDARLAIPMQGGIESLNVAVAASLVCYKATGLICGDELPTG